jgi:hypothetical protein
MNTSSLKNFAPAVRRQLIEAVTRKLDYVLTARTPDLLTVYALQVASLSKLAKADRSGLVERVAYTWFNRFAALRFMDAHGWHPFRARIITPVNPDETQPEILRSVLAGSLPAELAPFADPKRINSLLDGTTPSPDPQGEVYRHLVLAACRFYNALLPNLFERLDDETELLLPDDLLTEQSVVQGFRTEIIDADCSEVEILGWLYQFYISERKDQVMARKSAVPTEDIPAVTQLFTPHWIVRYLVENSMGRLWLLNRPSSRLREHMPYYIAGDSESDFLKINRPEDIRLCDPACGSGHMLTYAFDLLYRIYEEEGYSPSEIPGLILKHNLYGLEICPRATQLAELALVFKAREKSRRFFQPEQFINPNIIELRDVLFEAGELTDYFKSVGINSSTFIPHTSAFPELLHQFENAKNFGSLIQPSINEQAIVTARRIIEAKDGVGQLFLNETHHKILSVLEQAEALTQRYNVVVANPPYMGSNGMNGHLKLFIHGRYPVAKADLMTCFMSRATTLVLPAGYWGMINLPSWMFLGSFEEFRKCLLTKESILSLLHLGRGVFGSDFGSVAFTIQNKQPINARFGVYRRLFDKHVQVRNVDKINNLFLEMNENRFLFSQACFSDLPGHVLAYWLSTVALNIFKRGIRLGQRFSAKSGVMTGDDDFFLRNWQEVSISRIGFGYGIEAAIKNEHAFFPMNKEEGFRKWTGRYTTVFRYIDHGREHNERDDINYRLRDKVLYFQSGISWGDVTSGPLSFRYQPKGLIFAARAPTVFCDDKVLLAFLNSSLTAFFGSAINPTLSFNLADLYDLPLLVDEMEHVHGLVEPLVESLIKLSTSDWDNFETSWDFRDQPLLRSRLKGTTMEASWRNWEAQSTAAIHRMQELETENNRLFIEAYGLQDELKPDVPEDQITLARAEVRKDMAAFLSYAIGCMMGRYSLEKPGLVLADAGDTLQGYLSKVGKVADEIAFLPDEDGIIPVLDGEWFEDDIVSRTRDFLRATYGENTLRENLRFIEESLGKDIRKYFLNDFYKDHLQTYKKRPIYWLVQSPKKGFSVLIYLHRYTRDTLNIVLNRYLRPYQDKLRGRISHLEQAQADPGASPRDKTASRKEAEKLVKTLHECEEWERDTLLPLAQQRIELNLDDGVKVNYLKLGETLAPITGLATKEEE